MPLRAVAGPRNPTSIGTVAPALPQPGQMWWNLDDVKLYVWDGAEWVVTVNTPEVTGDTGSGGIPEAPSDGQVYGRNGQLTSWQVAATLAYVQGGFLPLSGGQLSGPLTLSGNATANLQAVAFQQLSGYVPITGTTMTGPLTLSGNATANLQPVTLQQQTTALGAYLPLVGGQLTGPLTTTTTGSLPGIPENTPNLSFVSGRIISRRQLSNATSPLPTYGGVNVYYNNLASTWPNLPWGGDAGASALSVNANAFPGCNGSTVALQGNLTSQGAHAYTSQDVCGSFTVTKLGQNSTWALSTQTQDNTGLAPGSFASVGAEIDILANGPDNPVSMYDYHLANRYMLYLAYKINPTTTYAASTHFGVGTIVVQTPPGGQPTCYICNTAGTTGATPPTWPTSGTVVDGTVIWTTGTTNASSLGTGIYLGADKTTPVTMNTGIGIDAQINNACIDLTRSTMTDNTCAAIRLGQDQPIDFTGGGNNANKNRRILSWSSYFDGLIYQALGKLVAVWGDDASVTMGGKILLAGGTNFSGVTTGYNDGYLTIGKNYNGNGEIDMITGAGPGGLSLFSTNGSGTIATPYVTFIPGGNPAIAVGANKVIGTQIAGWGTPTGGTRTASFPGATATLAQTSAVVAQLILDLKTHGLLGA